MLATTFKDGKDCDWTIAINIGALKALKASDINLAIPMLPRKAGVLPIWQEVMQDDALLADVLWILLKGQAETNGVKSQAAFDAALDTATIAAAREALAESLVDFSQPGNRAFVLETVRDIKELPDKMAKMREIQDSGFSSTSSPESSELTPPT